MPSRMSYKQRHYFANNGPYSQSYILFSSHVWLWELDHKEGWALKNWYFQIVVLEKTLKSPLDCREFEPVSPKGNRSTLDTHWKDWAPILWPPDARSWLRWKRPWCWERFRAGDGDDEGMRWMDGITSLIVVSKLQEIVKDRESWRAAIHGVSQLSDWTTTDRKSVV